MDENPSTEALNESAGEDTSVTTSPVEETTTSPSPAAAGESEGTSQGTQTADVPADAGDSEHQPVRPAARRIRELANENKRLLEEVSRFAQTPTQPQSSQPISEFLKGREEIDPSELDKIVEERVAQAGGAASSLEVQKFRFEMEQKDAVRQYDTDSDAIETRYPALDSKSDQYNPVLERAIAETWKAQAVQGNRINPSVRLTDVAERYMNAIQSAVERTTPVASSQADTLSVTPTAQPVREDVSFENLSTAEMEKRLKAQGYRI